MSNPFLLGPIVSGAPFMMVSIQGPQNTAYILNGAPLGQGVIYYWESNPNNLTKMLPIFTSSGTAGSVTISDSTNGGGIAFRTDGKTIGNAASPIPIKMDQTTYAPWWPPDTFIYGPFYTIFNSRGATGLVLTANASTAPTIPANTILILPVTWYFNCSSSGTYDTITIPSSSLLNWFCNVESSQQFCDGVTTIKGWTNITDCTNGFIYKYCPVGQNCGNNTCQGPCPQSYYDCDFSSGTYVCDFDSTKFFSSTMWYTSPYFIGAVIAIALIIVIFLIGIFLALRRGTPVDEQ